MNSIVDVYEILFYGIILFKQGNCVYYF